MWPRVVEVMLGCWLAISPAVFQQADATAALWATDLIAALLVVSLAVASFAHATRHAHFAILLVAAWLVARGYLVGHPAPPEEQNHILTGLVLALLAILPNHASAPPTAWREFRRRPD